MQGAAHIAKFLAAQGMHFEFVLDEGGFVISGIIPLLARPIGMINTGEKGAVSVHLTVDAVSGHSSNPPKVQVCVFVSCYFRNVADDPRARARARGFGRFQAIAVMAAALRRLDTHPLPPHMEHGPVISLIDGIAPYLPFSVRLVLCNMWLTQPLLVRVLGALPNIRTLVRTTTAFTIFKCVEAVVVVVVVVSCARLRVRLLMLLRGQG